MRCVKVILPVAGGAAALLLVPDFAFAQCALCRTALTHSAEGQRLASGFNTGILFLLSAPFVVVGTIAFLIFRPHLRRALRANRKTTTRRSRDRLQDYLELTKPEVASMIVISTLAGFYMASKGPLDLVLLLHTLMGTALVAGGTAAFNQFFEREDDAKMRRTARRPIPAGRLQPGATLWFAAVMSAGGALYLALAVNLLASFLAVLAWGSYLFLYTPLKKKTVLCTAVGALPGAMPPVIGWAAARNALPVEAWVLSAMLFLWQFPHFLSIAWMYREDYARAGIRMLPVADPSGKATGRQMVLCSSALLPLSLAPTLLGMAGTIFLAGSLVLGAAFLHFSVQAALTPSNVCAKRLLQASIIYLPLLFVLLMFDKR